MDLLKCIKVLLVVMMMVCCTLAAPKKYAAPPSLSGKYDTSPPRLRDTPLKGVYEWVYPFYARPDYRYPFYDKEGKGQLVYGYGGKQLHKYKKFMPIEGFHRR